MTSTSLIARLTFAALFSALLSSAAAQTPPPDAREVLTGLDAVALSQGKEVQGKEAFFLVREGLLYLFATPENKAAFEKDPAKYEVQLGGTCARMGPPTTGSPDLYAVHDGRIYLFGSEDCQRAFEAAPAKFLDLRAAAPALTADARAKGKALLSRAVEAMGGAARIAAVNSYEERSLNVATTPRGPRETRIGVLLVLPTQARFERAAQFGEVANVLAGAEAFTTFNKQGRPLNAFTRGDLERQRDRLLISVLRSAVSKDADVGAAGTMTAGGATLEKVVVRSGNEWVALGIDPQTAQIRALEYRGKGQGGEVGQVTQTYADHRTVDGLVLPFKIGFEFNGQPAPNADLTVQSIAINGAIDPALFKYRPGSAEALAWHVVRLRRTTCSSADYADYADFSAGQVATVGRSRAHGSLSAAASPFDRRRSENWRGATRIEIAPRHKPLAVFSEWLAPGSDLDPRTGFQTWSKGLARPQASA